MEFHPARKGITLLLRCSAIKAIKVNRFDNFASVNTLEIRILSQFCVVPTETITLSGLENFKMIVVIFSMRIRNGISLIIEDKGAEDRYETMTYRIPQHKYGPNQIRQL